MYLYRTVQYLIIGAIAYVLLFVGGKVGPLPQDRIDQVGTALHTGAVGAARTAADIHAAATTAPAER